MHKAKRLLAEPLLWFAVLGAMLFAADAALHPHSGKEIRVTAQDVERLRALAIKQYGAAPDEQRLQALVRNYVREEVLYREALAQGLDREDEIVRKRLVQKMEFLAQGGAEPLDEARAQAWFAAHADRYGSGEQVAFEHVLFSTSRHGMNTLRVAQHALHAARNGGAVPAGDAAMLARSQPLQGEREVARDFGAAFAAAVMNAPAGGWQGPIASPLGQHLVRVVERKAASVPTYAEARQRVLADLGGADLAAARERGYESARKQYSVALDEAAQ